MFPFQGTWYFWVKLLQSKSNKKTDVFTDVEKLYFSVKRTSIIFIYNFQKSSFIKDVAIVNDIL